MQLTNKPVLCNYYVTYRCNASCQFCDIWERPSPYVTPENVEKNLIDLKKLGVKVIDFTGGEPLLHRQIDQLLTKAKSLGFITTLTTNALLYSKWAEKIKGKVDMLHFSLDYDNAAQHDEKRGVKCFDFVIEAIKIAKKIGERPDILMTVFDDNIDHIETIYHQITRPNELILILNPAFEYHQLPTQSQLNESQLQTLTTWARKKNVYLNEAFLLLRKNGGNHTQKPICKAATTTIVISPENEWVLPCYHLGLESIPINNQLYQLYHHPDYQTIKQSQGTHPACEGCTINCYMQPTFATHLSPYFWKALPSTLKYNLWKGTWKQLFKKNK